MTALDEFLTTREVAAHYKVSPRTVQRWRHEGVGPRFITIGRDARYPLRAVLEHDQQKIANTA